VTFDLRAHGARPALLAAEETLTYADLANRADDLLTELGPERRLILLRGRTSVDFVVALMAALVGRHPVIVAPPQRRGRADDLFDVYDPDIVIDTDAGGRDHQVTVRRDRSAHALHPDLALLLSTSGSTGSPKLVRLSHTGLRSNAAAIATYLKLTEQDRGILTLPLHYCYGLSVLTSHLYAGAATIVTDWSVLDPCLWDLARTHRATGLAGVPHTFDQLDQLGFPELPSLRYVTAAGGKLAPERVTHYLGLGQSRGWDFYVMYGQTEATARMAYLPPDLAEAHPSAVGVPIPGGSLRIEHADDQGIGELVYAGPNVMMGYAHAPADLAGGAELNELHTGDLACEIAPGVFEVVGRRSRFAKVFGLRLDLDEIERKLPFTAACIEIDGVVGVVSPSPRAADAVADLCDIPGWSVRDVLADVPLTASGKPDRSGVTALVVKAASTPVSESARRSGVAALYEQLLQCDVTPEDTFVSLGADSLSYVELSVRLGEIVDPLPRDWHRRSIAELDALTTPDRRRTRGVSVDPTVLLRAVAITFIVGTHANLLGIMGGAHALLAVCGYNAARFLPAGERPAGTLLRGAWHVALPSTLWLGALAAFGVYAPTTALFLNGALGADRWTDDWRFWFLEAAIWTLVGVATLLTIPILRRLDAQHPFAAALVLLAGTASLRYALVGIDTDPVLPERYSIPVVAWCFALGWAAARAERSWQRILVACAAMGLSFGFFGDPARELIIGAAVAALLWARPVRLPRWVATACGMLAAASLSIYLTHWQIYPHLEYRFPLAATVLSLLVGVAYHRICGVVGRVAGDVRGRIAVNVDRRIQRGTDEDRDRQDIKQEQHRDGRRQGAIDGRAHGADAQHPPHEVAAQDPHDQREDGTGDTHAPWLPHRHRQVVQGRHEASREHQDRRPVGTP
jgi:acyl-CoA synthetase (AMP-forming)/AMP-acid ligase II